MKNIFVIVSIVVFLFSCAKDQPEVAWLVIDKWDFVNNPDAAQNQGDMSHDFSQVFLNMDGKALGVFELPAKIPIITESGSHNLVIIPGVISYDGFVWLKIRYPHAEQYTGQIHLEIGDTAYLTPTTRYYNSTKVLHEGFENPSIQIEVAQESVGTITRSNDSNYLQWGNNFGKIKLTEQDSMVTFVTNFGEGFPKPGTEVFLEFDYLNTNSAMISVISYGNNYFYNDPFIVLMPQEEGKAVWKHAYLNLKQLLSERMLVPGNEIQFQFYLDDDKEESLFLIDNIKVIYP